LASVRRWASASPLFSLNVVNVISARLRAGEQKDRAPSEISGSSVGNFNRICAVPGANQI
jgi:hypothetical protein